MSTDTLALMKRLQSASTLDWRATRDEIHELHKRATTSHERDALLAIYTVVMDQVERSGTITRHGEVQGGAAARLQPVPDQGSRR